LTHRAKATATASLALLHGVPSLALATATNPLRGGPTAIGAGESTFRNIHETKLPSQRDSAAIN
jgi:hypothetical protein